MMLTMPNVQFSEGSPACIRVAGKLKELGFRFRRREVPGGILVSANGSATVELDTVEELVALQRSIGLPICVEDGILEIRSD